MRNPLGRNGMRGHLSSGKLEEQSAQRQLSRRPVKQPSSTFDS